MAKETQKQTNKNKDKNTAEEQVSTVRVMREYVEALGVALVLAFIFKAFVIEAYSIPTGSMASTLMGRHKDIACEACGFQFQLGIKESSEIADSPSAPSITNLWNIWNILWRRTPRENVVTTKIVAGTCPNCYYATYLDKDNTAREPYPSYNGDRIFVNKNVFDFRNPARWHVTVFRYPADPYTNFIKRLVGVENETLQIHNGDIFVMKNGETEFKIQRKPLRQLLSMLRPVNDNDYVVPMIHKIGYPERWQGDKVWGRSEDYRSFRCDASDDETHWLTYQNIVPSSKDWLQLLNHRLPMSQTSGKPQLITDYLAYNSDVTVYGDRMPSEITVADSPRIKDRKVQQIIAKNPGVGQNWVGDLALSCRLNIVSRENMSGSVFFRLVKGGIAFVCEMDLSNKCATFSIPDVPEFKLFAVDLPFKTGGTYDVKFCNIDEELRLMINGKEIDLQEKGEYDALCLPKTKLARDRSPTAADLEPAAIGVKGLTAQVEHLKIERDQYYISCDARMMDMQCDLINSPFPNYEGGIREILTTPSQWSELGKTRVTTFELGKDQFLMCGDNSAQSKDSRLWTSDGIPHYVDRKFLIGEAFYVYWPHGWFIPGTNIALVPNFPKMRWID
ncbi:MAG: S26 family signal peptidase [Planctomycetaceae bacterium]|jgi:signal peptidase I|nr:S26 family signal peptidase [Planctomycetaceae bacterium]